MKIKLNHKYLINYKENYEYNWYKGIVRVLEKTDEFKDEDTRDYYSCEYYIDGVLQKYPTNFPADCFISKVK